MRVIDHTKAGHLEFGLQQVQRAHQLRSGLQGHLKLCIAARQEIQNEVGCVLGLQHNALTRALLLSVNWVRIAFICARWAK